MAVESTFNSYWLVVGLKDAGLTMRLASATAIVSGAALRSCLPCTDGFESGDLSRWSSQAP